MALPSLVSECGSTVKVLPYQNKPPQDFGDANIAATATPAPRRRRPAYLRNWRRKANRNNATSVYVSSNWSHDSARPHG